MLSAISSAVTAMRAAELRLQQSAARIAHADEGGAAPSSIGTVASETGAGTPSPRWLAAPEIDVAGALLDQVEAGTNFAVALETLETIQYMVKRLYGLAD